ncbi:hypothetical protein [Micromonospora sp. NPDC005305]|uniref:hypothetical protein n=1 Tax=Micromonospora sp. NPDC005305 TaxID=3156875 RepID=UPI0033B7F184
MRRRWPRQARGSQGKEHLPCRRRREGRHLRQHHEAGRPDPHADDRQGQDRQGKEDKREEQGLSQAGREAHGSSVPACHQQAKHQNDLPMARGDSGNLADHVRDNTSQRSHDWVGRSADVEQPNVIMASIWWDASAKHVL